MSTGVPQYHIIEPQTQADGKHAWVDTNKIPLRDEKGNVIGVLGTYEDITERKQSEEELRRSQQMLQLVLNNIPQAVFWKDLNSVYLGGNPSFAVDAGLDHPDQLTGLTDLDLAWTIEQAEAFIQTDQRVMDNDSPEHHILEQQQQADGKLAWLDTNKIPLHDSEGNVVGILGTYEDITERKAAEEALQQAHTKLEQRVQERTAELVEINLLLRQQILERERAELAEREQRTLAEVLRDIAVVLNSTLNLETVLDRILSEIDRVVPHDTANIILIENQQARTVRFRGRKGFTLQPPDPERRFDIAELPNLQEMIRTRLPLVIVDTQLHPNWVTRPSSPWVRSYLGAPILFEERVIGFINLNSSHPAFFDQPHAERLQVLTHQAAIAIQNARLYAQAQELAAVEERQRLARDLHDAVSQTLWTASLIAEVLPTLWQQDQDEALQSLEKLRRLTQGALAEMRTLLLELRPAALVEAKIGSLMNQLAQATMSRKKVDITLEVHGDVELPPDVQIGIYRVAQEALNNIVKHSHATQVSMRVICEEDLLDLYLSDDGRGFNPGEVAARQFGLDIMRERAQGIGASLALSSEIGKGTQVHLHWSRFMPAAATEEYA
jgi:PAS domain S-box-containing protein